MGGVPKRPMFTRFLKIAFCSDVAMPFTIIIV